MKENKKNEINEPFGELIKPINQFFNRNSLKGFLQQIDDLFNTPFPFVHPLNAEVSETENEYMIQAELPGIKREQIEIEALNQYVIISIHSSEALIEEDENGKVISKQQSIQSSKRTIPLQQPIIENSIKASYENGLLKIRIQKQRGKKIMLDDHN
jgi:HSP20 family protein